MKKLITKKFGKVLAGVLSCCILLSGCGVANDEEISWQLGEETTSDVEASFGEEAEIMESDTAIMQDSMIYVYICGAVKNPGVYQIAEGSRLFEAIDVAGGMMEEADLTSQNLARVLQDGEQVRILTKEEAQQLVESGLSVQTGNTTESKGLVNINTASVQELTSLSGIGESRAQAIVEYRETNGFFKSIDGIKKVAGIKEGLFEKIKNQITV